MAYLLNKSYLFRGKHLEVHDASGSPFFYRGTVLGYTTATTNGRLMINLRLAITERECDTDGDRIRDVLDHRAKQGFVITGSFPAGLKAVDKRVVREEETNHIVQELFNQMELLNSIRKAMVYVNDKYGTKFSYPTTRKMLNNPLYYGCFHGVENYCEPTITKEQFDNVQRIMKMNVRVRKNKHTYIFSGLLVCDHCNNRMPGKYCLVHGNEYYYYRCNKAIIDKQCDNRGSINTVDIENYLFENVERLIEEHILSVELESKETKVQKSNRKTMEKKLQRLNDLYVNGFIDLDKYKSDYAELQSQIVDVAPQVQKKRPCSSERFSAR